MIKYICDLCHKETDELNTIILHKTYFQHCKKCKSKAYMIQKSFRKEIIEEYIEFEKRIKELEETYIKNI